MSGGIRYNLVNFSQHFLEPFRKGIHEKTSAAFSSGYIGYTFDTKQKCVHLLCTTITAPFGFVIASTTAERGVLGSIPGSGKKCCWIFLIGISE